MNIKSLFDNFNNANILIIGDVMIDRYISGKINRISPEAPVPILDFNKEENRVGGAANVALNIKALGATPILCSIIGDDENGILLKKLLSEKEIPPDNLVSIPNRQTTVKTRLLASSQQILRVDKEEISDIDEKYEKAILAQISKLVSQNQIQGIILQDYNKGLLTKAVIQNIIEIGNKNRIAISVDPKKKNFNEYQNVTLFKPNLKEVKEALNIDIQPNIHDLRKASDLLKVKLNFKSLMVTLSEAGIYINDGTKDGIFPTTPRLIADVCGAGDTVISTATLAISNGLTLDQIALICNTAGGQVCEEVGVVPINKSKLYKEIFSKY